LKRTSIFLVLAVMIAVTVLVAGCTTQQPTTVTPAPTPSVTTAAPTSQTAMKDIIETARADGRFTTFIAALEAANLTETLTGTESFTVFAPTDDAFRKLPEGTMTALLKNPEGDLTQILLYHVISGKVMAADIVKLTSAETLQGGFMPISIENSTVTVDGATVIITDIECSNGVIHGVDTVMLPPA
jgi:transforming growth factor-beta-induced protein